jgi:hypothetical protein
MNAVGWMVGSSVAVWLTATAMAGTRASVDVLAGMLGPLAVATSTWVMTERTYRRHPERLTALMMTAFGVKMVFFGAYVAIALTALSLRPIPFVTSFIGYFIGLYFIEALYLRRLFAGGNGST